MNEAKDMINRQAALDALMEAFCDTMIESICKDTIEALPSAQPEIIWCEDCIWWKDEDCTNPVGMFLPDEDCFCSCATRRRERGSNE